MPHSALHSTPRRFTSLHFSLVHFTLHTSHCPLHTSHSTLNTPHSTLHTSNTRLHTPHFTLHTPHFKHQASHSTLHTSQCTSTRHNTPPFLTFPIDSAMSCDAKTTSKQSTTPRPPRKTTRTLRYAFGKTSYFQGRFVWFLWTCCIWRQFHLVSQMSTAKVEEVWRKGNTCHSESFAISLPVSISLFSMR